MAAILVLALSELSGCELQGLRMKSALFQEFSFHQHHLLAGGQQGRLCGDATGHAAAVPGGAGHPALRVSRFQ